MSLESPTLTAGEIPVVAFVHPAGEAGVPAPVHGNSKLPASEFRYFIGREHVAGPVSVNVDENEIPGRQSDSLQDALYFGMNLHEITKPCTNLVGHAPEPST